MYIPKMSDHAIHTGKDGYAETSICEFFDCDTTKCKDCIFNSKDSFNEFIKPFSIHEKS